jgi:trehalose 6-phosphate synthase/phosphatase
MSQDGPWKAYKQLNQEFADTIVKNYKEGDISK